MRRALPLSIQLLLTFVGLLLGMAAVLTTAAYTSLVANLRTEASRRVSLATRTRAEALSQVFRLRQQRAEGFLTTLESFCAEPLDSGRLAWAQDCSRPMVDDFRKSERAMGALLTYRNRRVGRSGQRVSDETVPSGALAKVVRTADGAVEYVMKASRRQTALTLQFSHERTTSCSMTSAFGRAPSVSHRCRRAVSPLRHAPSTTPAEAAASAACPDPDGRRRFQRGEELSEFSAAQIGRRVWAQAALRRSVGPPGKLRVDRQRVAWFVVGGMVLSLVAAHWISAPVRRLALSARKLQTGQFERPLPLGGPSEVRELGRAFNAMSNDLAELVAKEQAARREAEDANRSKDDFLATVSHELRTPLTAVLGWAQMLRADDVPPDRLRHGLAVIERSARAQSRLIDDLLDVSRIVSNRFA